MPPKRKAQDKSADMDRPDRKKKKAPKDTKSAPSTPEVYSSQQKAAIVQFQGFTQLDRNAAVRLLKTHGWDAQTAVNAYYSGGGGGASTGSTSSKAALIKLFEQYRDTGADADVVGVEGTMKYFQEIDVDVEGLESLAALEIVQAPTMGEMTRDGFVNGWQERSCDTIAKQKAYVKTLKKDLPMNKDLYTRVYKYTFSVAKTPGSKAVTLDAAVAYWELLFSSELSAVKWNSSNSPWLSWWNEFLTSSWKRSVNKDMWNETLKFAQLTLEKEDLSFWNEDSSWPSVIDEFVAWVKTEKRKETKEEVEEEEY
ncbi:Scaffold-type E3 ligase [Coniothyrium glycines]